jgi:hypothetical protein
MNEAPPVTKTFLPVQLKFMLSTKVAVVYINQTNPASIWEKMYISHFLIRAYILE